MPIDDLKKQFDNKFQEHIHKGTDAKKVLYESLTERPDALLTTLTADLALGGKTIIGSTLITGQAEVTEIADADKLILGDASDSGNLKYITRENYGRIYIVASNTSYLSVPTQTESDVTFTVPFAGVFRLKYTLRKTDTDPAADDGDAELEVYNNCNNTVYAAVNTTGGSTRHITTSNTSVSEDIFTYPGTKYRLNLKANTNIINFNICYTPYIGDDVVVN